MTTNNLTGMNPETFERLDPNGPTRTFMREMIEQEWEY